MAIDTENKRRSAIRWHPILNVFPVPDGTISVFDRRHAAGRYRGLPVPVALGGTLTPTGALSRTVERFRSLDGGLTPTGALSRVLTAYRSLGGGLTPTGDLTAAMIFVMALGGELNLSGALVAANPSWLLIDDDMIWQGEWVATTSYDIDDTVLYKADTDTEWHVFVSKISHNVGNNPDSSAAAWRRLYQEQWL